MQKKCQPPTKENEIQKLKDEITELRLQMQTQAQTLAKALTQNITINNGTINNNNVTVNAFGKEDISYITEHVNFKKFMHGCIRNKTYGLMNFIEKKHFNPAHPENHNIKKLNKKDKFIRVYDGKKWQSKFVEEAIDEMLRGIQNVFINFVEAALMDKEIAENVVKRFLEDVGRSIDWDVYVADVFEEEVQITDAKRDELRSKIFDMANEFIYQHSKECHAH